MSPVKITDKVIYDATHYLPWNSPEEGSIRKYRAFYLPSSIHESHGIAIPECRRKRPILLLAGTSIPLSDRSDLVRYFVEAGYEVASIINPIGGPFDFGIDPKKDRVDALRDYLDWLIEVANVRELLIVAQSYSAYETVRLLFENPDKYEKNILGIVFINPPVLNEGTGVIKHCSRFVWHHVLKGCSGAVGNLLGKDSTVNDRSFARREMAGIVRWTCNTFRNPVRTMKEVLDIVSYRIKDRLAVLVKKHQYDINLFLQSDDQLLPIDITLGQLQEELCCDNIKIVPGGHNDIFFQACRRNELIEFIRQIMLRTVDKYGRGLDTGLPGA